jgi:CxxC-x17-CxxC domain-containing protein
MSDQDKPASDQPATDQPVTDQPSTDEPKAGATSSDEPTAVGTDQYGRQLYEVTCAACGKKTQVPFKPSGDRPVYCRDCYMQQRRERRGGGMGRGPRR